MRGGWRLKPRLRAFWRRPQSPPFGPLPLRALLVRSEPIGSRGCPARASRPQAQRTAALLVIFVRQWQALTHWRCTDATLHSGWRLIGAEKKGQALPPCRKECPA
jgi:hypothetical protein